MVKGKTIKKERKVSKQKVSLPSKIKKGQITKKELKSIGFTTPDNELKSSAPVESISGIGIKKGAMLRAGGIEDVSDYKKSFKDFFLEQRAKKKPKPKPIKPKPKPIKPKPKPIKPKPKPIKPKPIKPKPKVKTYFVADKVTEKLVSNELHGEKEADIQRFINTLVEKRPSVKKDDLVIIRADTAAEAKDKLMRKRKYYLVNRETGEVASKPFAKHDEALKAKELFNFPTHISHSKPENIDNIAIKVKRRFDALPKSEQDKMRQAAKKRVEKEEIVEAKPVKKVKAPRKGNEYISNVMLFEMTAKPKLSDWKNEKGKIRKKALSKLLIGLYEAEYGKDSSQVKEAKSLMKDLRGSDVYDNITSYTANYDPQESFEFPH